MMKSRDFYLLLLIQSFQCVKTVTQKTYLNNLDADKADGGSSKFDFDANGYHRKLFETLAEATDKWYENTTDQFFLIGPEQLLMGTNNIGFGLYGSRRFLLAKTAL